ncbi:MAG: hypothetical protein CM1200mP9_00260 [Gammaproteobacteria bacterium]|nr:MAG: hypothetical protein CM1200mP9_00260 [Gammaproteobacteria bacterium]
MGKSSILNALVGMNGDRDRHSWDDRDLLDVDLVIDGLPIRVRDTAGIREVLMSLSKRGLREPVPPLIARMQ